LFSEKDAIVWKYPAEKTITHISFVIAILSCSDSEERVSLLTLHFNHLGKIVKTSVRHFYGLLLCDFEKVGEKLWMLKSRESDRLLG
jgi:hypothetical protein